MTLPFASTRLVGIDPGTETGLICLDLPRSWSIMEATVVGFKTLKRTSSTKLTENERDIHHRLTLMQTLQEWAPEHVALECPKDVSDGWGKGGRRVGTGFRLGVMYAMALTAIPPGCQVGTYLVRGSKKTGRGWRGFGSKPMIYLRLKELAWHLKLPPEIPDHILDALGVASYYCQQQEAMDAET